MSTIPTPLTLTDPLAAQPVTIMTTLPAAESPRDERPALVSIGSDGQSPVFKQGVLADVAALIDQAWTAYGVRAELQAAQAQAAEADLPAAAADSDTETVATAIVDKDEAEEAALQSQPLPPAPPVKATPLPPPKPKNLSLF
jgi:hypothetical protein